MCRDSDSVAVIYDGIFMQHVRDHYIRKRVKYIKRHFEGRRKILDVGCGTGLLAQELGKEGFDIYGLDISQEMLKLAAPRLSGKIVCATAGKIPFPSENFDGVICVATMHHIHSVFRDALREMARVLKTGGRLLIWDHNPINPYWLFLMNRVPQDVGSERLFPAGVIIKEMEECGIEIIRCDRTGFVPDFAPLWLMPLFVFFEKGIEKAAFLNLICAHNVILGEKRHVEK
jgi:SAM-dependent methyltransferase